MWRGVWWVIIPIRRGGCSTALYKNQFMTTLHVIEETGKTAIQCQLDTGATCNVMSLNDLCGIKQQGNPPMKFTMAKLKLYDGRVIPVLGEATLTCSYKEGQWQDIMFKTICANQKPLLSGETCLSLGFISINSIHTVETEDMDSLLREFKDVFEGLGNMWGEYHIDTNKAVPLVQHTPRHTPIALKERLRQKI